ncbi:MAG: hypothetical protein HFF44_03130 [Lawsonibacter sp.]|nr:hypothetical protein [Lawsonibacter sp.]
MSWPWSQLGLPGPSELPEIRRAYAERLKTTHPEEDPEGFQRLHSAYQLASRMARQKKRQTGPVPIPQTESPSWLKEKPREEGFDFDQLLQDGDEAPRRPRAEEGERDFDFDQLLQDEDEDPRQPPEEEQDFDFERLFAEGEAERAEERRRRGEERRRAQAQMRAWARERQKAKEWTQRREQWQRQEEQNTYDQERRDQFSREEERWQNTETILHTLEMLWNAQAPLEEWEKFFASPLFQQSKGSLDLIFGLEDFVGTGKLSQGARRALFLAYKMDQGTLSRPELRPLYQMLLPAWKSGEQDKRQQKLYKIRTYAAGILLGPVALLLLASGGFLAIGLLLLAAAVTLVRLTLKDPDHPGRKWAALWLLALGAFTYVCYDRGWGMKLPLSILAVGAGCVMIRGVLRLGRQERQARGMPRNKRDERWIVAVMAVCLIVGLAMLFIPELRAGLGSFPLPQDPRAQVCRYLELDYGEKFHSLYTKDSPRFDNVFAPKDSQTKLFLAGPDGDRAVREGKLGYTTNYPEMMVLWSLKDFAAAHSLRGVDTMDRNQNLESWSTCGVYLIVLPRYGAGETITDLGELLEQMAEEDWYRVRTPEFKVVLCSEQMEEGRMILQEYQPSQGAFDVGEVRALYEESFGHACCGQLLKELELDRDFVHGGEERYTLTNQGMAQCKGENCFLLYGLDSGGGVAMEYYVSTDSGSIFCVPGGFWESGGTDGDIQFYRMVNQNGNGGFTTLYYPWITVS